MLHYEFLKLFLACFMYSINIYWVYFLFQALYKTLGCGNTDRPWNQEPYLQVLISSLWSKPGGYINHTFFLFNQKRKLKFNSVQSLTHIRLIVTPWIAACQASLSITNSWSLLKLMSIESVMPSNHLILYYPLLLLPSVLPSTRVFSNESVLHIRWPKYWSFSFKIGPFNEYSELISFRMDWLDLLAVQGTPKSLLQYHSSKASVLQPSLWSNSHIHTWLLEKTITLTKWTFVGKVMSVF